MDPCQFCGQLAAVDGAGFCTNCRNYRGVPAQPPAGYQTGYPASGAPYPSSAPSYGGQVSSPPYGPVSGGPVSGAPATGYPTGYPQAQPTSYPPAPATGYQAPGYPQSGVPVSAPAGLPSGPDKQRNPYLVPIIAVCSVLALLAISIVVVVVLRSGGGKNNPTPPPVADSSAANSDLDQCLVGKWLVTDYTTSISVGSAGDVFFIAEDLNETLDIKADGSVTDNYGTTSQPTILIGSSDSHNYKISVSGTITYKMQSAHGTLTFSNAVANGKIAVEVDGVSAGTEDLSASNDPTPYTCSGNTFRQTTKDFDATAKKTS
jgi:hypothetical protein